MDVSEERLRDTETEVGLCELFVLLFITVVCDVQALPVLCCIVGSVLGFQWSFHLILPILASCLLEVALGTMFSHAVL